MYALKFFLAEQLQLHIENSSESDTEVVDIFLNSFIFRKRFSINNCKSCSCTYELKINILHPYFNIRSKSVKLIFVSLFSVTDFGAGFCVCFPQDCLQFDVNFKHLVIHQLILSWLHTPSN